MHVGSDQSVIPLLLATSSDSAGHFMYIDACSLSRQLLRASTCASHVHHMCTDMIDMCITCMAHHGDTHMGEQQVHTWVTCGSHAWRNRRLRGSLEGNPEPGDRLRFVFVFVSCVACVRAGEAKLRVRARCRVFLLTLASAVGSSPAAFAASLRSSGRGVYVGFKAKWVQI